MLEARNLILSVIQSAGERTDEPTDSVDICLYRNIDGAKCLMTSFSVVLTKNQLETLEGRLAKSSSDTSNFGFAASSPKRPSPVTLERPVKRIKYEFAEPMAYFRSVGSSDPNRIGESINEPLVRSFEYKDLPTRSKPPKHPFDNCPFLMGPGDKNRIKTLLACSNKGKRMIFLTRFEFENMEDWVDHEILAKLEPRHVWVDWVRGVYILHSRHRRAMEKASSLLGFELGAEVISCARQITLARATQSRRISSAKRRECMARQKSNMTTADPQPDQPIKEKSNSSSVVKVEPQVLREVQNVECRHENNVTDVGCDDREDSDANLTHDENNTENMSPEDGRPSSWWQPIRSIWSQSQSRD